ncbi:hypothetical protein [Staphylococcus haemolyticus]|uniref:hypothetical protein n=1 Tax=Staphylococcus haemolyticus TaxID=1283 RepID=UPI003D962EAE
MFDYNNDDKHKQNNYWNNNNNYNEQDNSKLDNNDFENQHLNDDNNNLETTNNEVTDQNEHSNTSDIDTIKKWNILALKSYLNQLKVVFDDAEVIYGTIAIKPLLKYSRPLIELLRVVIGKSNAEIIKEIARLNNNNTKISTSINTFTHLSQDENTSERYLKKKRIHFDTIERFLNDVENLLNEDYQSFLNQIGNDFEITEDTIKKVLN